MTLKILLAGCGAMSKAWLEVAREIDDVALVGFVDLQRAAAEARANEFGESGALVETDIERALNIAQPDIVFDCTIPEAHYSVTLAALAHGCHVLGEKPLADSLDHARQMVTAAESAGKLYAVMQNRRYDRHFYRLRTLVNSGKLGKLTTINSDFYIGAHFGGFRDVMPHVLLLDMAIHTIDVARALSDADPVSVYCKEWNPEGSWYARDASAIAIFEMSNGLVYTYRGSWCAEGLPTTWEADWRIIGTQGTATWDGAERLEAQVVVKADGFFSTVDDQEFPMVKARYPEGHAGVIHEFVDCVRSGDGLPQTICTDNIKSLAMVFAAIESAEKGLPVPVVW